jgi:proline iminopeptidase
MSDPAAQRSPLAHLDFLYPPIEADQSGYLEPQDGHSVWWEASGAPEGLPVLFLHGGPGAPSRPHHRQFFDPAGYRMITLHQRGCGRSTPLAETHANTTQTLVADIERLRVHLQIDRWLIMGGSWGSALALAYGEAHPERCLGFVLLGVTLNRPGDWGWWWNGTRMLFPEAFDAFVSKLPPTLRATPLQGYHHQLMDPDPRIHLPAAKALCMFSAATVARRPSPAQAAAYDDPDVALPLARLFTHYSANGFFLGPNQLLEGLDVLVDKPCAILGGRYDVTTPMECAWRLHRAWPGSTLTIQEDGAHALSDPASARARLDARETMKSRLRS